MFGWTGRFLHVNLSRGKAVADAYDATIAKSFLGGRGFAVKMRAYYCSRNYSKHNNSHKLVR